MLNPNDLAVDPDDAAQSAEALLCEEQQDILDTALIIGQLDPTEVDYAKGVARWTESQRAIIMKCNQALVGWRSGD